MYFIQSELFYYNLLSVVTKKESNLKEKKKHKMLPALFLWLFSSGSKETSVLRVIWIWNFRVHSGSGLPIKFFLKLYAIKILGSSHFSLVKLTTLNYISAKFSSLPESLFHYTPWNLYILNVIILIPLTLQCYWSGFPICPRNSFSSF